MPKSKLDRRTKTLVGVLGLVVAAWGFSVVETRALESELSEIADEKILELVSPEDQERTEVGEPVVVVSRKYILVGTPIGKISIYLRPLGAGKMDADNVQAQAGHSHGGITGVEYVLERRDGRWVDVESAMCGSEQCAIEGAKAFR